ncbi:MAG: dephospho-CoA kinase [Planctomycetota bacterium]
MAGSNEILTIGLAGAIGAGKTTVAKVLASLGCVVSDSDSDARAALDRKDVRQTLTEWWGEEVLDDNNKIDRRKIAKIVFDDAEQRRRLEDLVHPKLHDIRGERRRDAAREAAPAFVIDAPLLFEAGVDEECDAVIFVDAPRELRLERVRTDRGWDEAELDRREQAQLPVEEKKSRASIVVENDGTLTELRARVSAALDEIRAG